MLKDFNRINIKYGVAFVAVALSLIFVMVVDAILVNSVKQRMLTFSGVFNVATSEVLNADRDLFQARIAEMAYLEAELGSAAANAIQADFGENATQAYDRIQEFSRLMRDYPEVRGALEGYEEFYETWLNAAEQVFSLQDSGDRVAAREQLESASLDRFNELRDIYNLAGEAADQRVADLEAETLEQIRSQQWSVTAFAVIVGLVAIVIALVGPHLMSKAIREVSDRIREITEGDGDLTSRIHSRRGDEIGELAEHFNGFISRMDNTLLAVRDSAGHVDRASSEMTRNSEELASRTEQSSANLHETSASMEEITTTVQHTTDATEQANALVNTTVEIARRGSKAMNEVEATMAEIDASATRIQDIIALIDSIAFQTNILALNASVEAARAGEHGRGFAVVAQEVRTLASRCGDASHEIRDLVEETASNTRSGANLVSSAGRTMQEIVSSIEEVTGVINEISIGAREQSQGIGQVNTAVAELDTMTQHNASMVEESRTAADEMHQQARHLMKLLAGFRLGDAKTDAVSPSHLVPAEITRIRSPQKHLGQAA